MKWVFMVFYFYFWLFLVFSDLIFPSSSLWGLEKLGFCLNGYSFFLALCLMGFNEFPVEMVFSGYLFS